MKKIIAMLVLCVLLMSMVASVAVSAAPPTPKERIVMAMRENMPAQLATKWIPTAENVLRQIPVSEEQADGVIACILRCRAFIKNYKGESIHHYTKEEMNYALEQFYLACEILRLRYTVSFSKDPDHVNDVVYTLYTETGKKLADLDGDTVRKTNVPESNVNYVYVVLAATLLLGAVAAVYAGKKFAAVER